MLKSSGISILALFASVLIVACATTKSEYQPTAADYKLYAMPAATPATISDIVTAARDASVIFFGEEHNDRVGHYLERLILDSLYAAYGDSLALSMEMFNRDAQVVVDEYLQGYIRERELIRDGQAWNNYAHDYSPLVEFAKAHHLPVVAANAPSRYTSLAGRKGQDALLKLSETARGWLAPLPYDTATGGYFEKLMGESHDPTAKATSKDTTKKDTAHAAPPPGMPPGFNLNVSQSLWDATMAASLARQIRAHPGMRIFQVNGRFHSDQRYGIVQQLKKYVPPAKTIVISSGRIDDFTHPPIDSLKSYGDFVIFTSSDVPPTYELK